MMEIGNGKLYVGHVLDCLKEIPDESVQCCITSPPYWGLRAYGTNHQVWGGDDGCEHEFEGCGGKTVQPQRDHETGTRGEEAFRKGSSGSMSLGNICHKCSAWKGEFGLEPNPELYIQHLVEIFREVRRVLRKDGIAWLNLGSSYAGSGKGIGGDRDKTKEVYPDENIAKTDWSQTSFKPKDLVPVPWMAGLALQKDGWWLRSDIIWSKNNCMPSSVTDRCTTSHEYVLMLAKSKRYFYDNEAIKEPLQVNGASGIPFGGTKLAGGDNPTYSGNEYDSSKLTGRNKRSVWAINTQPFPEAHFAVFPPKLIEPMVLASTSEKGCCGGCGAPMERIVERNSPSKEFNIGADERYDGMLNMGGNHQTIAGLHRQKGGVYSTAKDMGWRNGCSCDSSTNPCTILDPFLGSGTTALVCEKHNRRWIGIELNPDYVDIIKNRLEPWNGQRRLGL